MKEYPMIDANGVVKTYRLGVIGGTTLKEDLQRLGAKLRKKDDPTRKIGDDNLRCEKKYFNAIDDISFKVNKGETVGIIGHNGAGKSTLLKLITRVTAPDKGFIGLNGRITSMLEVGTGFHPELTGRENIYMNGAILGMSKSEIDRKLEEIIDFSEVREFIDTPVKRYSSGMYVKLAFSVAAHLDSEILIMDEVLAVGDVAFQQKCIDKMKNTAIEDGKTILYVSHNMSTIRQLCNRCIVLDHGQIIFDGDVDTAIEIYLKKQTNYARYIDFSCIKRSPNEKRNLELLSINFPDRLNSIIPFTDRNRVPVEINCKANDYSENIKMRYEVIYSDTTIAGASISNQAINAKKGELLNICGTLDFSNLVPGDYTVALLLFESNNYGQEVGIDRVFPAFSFRIEESNDQSELKWMHQYWGHVRLNDFIINRIEIRNEHETQTSFFD